MAVIAAAFFIWPSILTIRGTGGWSTAGIELLVIPVLIAFVILALKSTIRLVRLLRRKQKKSAFPQLSLGIVIGGVLGIWGGGELRMYGFELASERAMPLVSAIKQYVHTNGEPPVTLSELVPDYLAELPGRLPPLEIVTEPQLLAEYGDNPWALSGLVSRALMNWDMFIYFPDQEYPSRGFGGRLERIGAWAYVHE